MNQEIGVYNAMWIGCRIQNRNILPKNIFLLEKETQISFQCFVDCLTKDVNLWLLESLVTNLGLDNLGKWFKQNLIL